MPISDDEAGRQARLEAAGEAEASPAAGLDTPDGHLEYVRRQLRAAVA